MALYLTVFMDVKLKVSSPARGVGLQQDSGTIVASFPLRPVEGARELKAAIPQGETHKNFHQKFFGPQGRATKQKLNCSFIFVTSLDKCLI